MEKITWHTETRLVNQLIPFAHNPRTLSKLQFAQLKESLAKFDYAECIAINTDNMIIAGHMRVKAMMAMKWQRKAIEVRVPSRFLELEEMKEYLIRSNKNTGEWDFDELADNFETRSLLEWGFEPEELGIDLEEEAELPEEDSTLSPPTNPLTQIGDIYCLGPHRLVCGDSTLPATVESCLAGAIPILMVTDPPYGVNYDPGWREEIKGKHGKGARALGKVKNDERINWTDAWTLFPGNIAYVWHASLFTQEVYSSLKEAEFEIISNIIWVKQHFALSRGDYHWQHEPCWYAVRRGAPHNWQGARDQATIWEISNLNAFGTNKEDERTCHSTQKPLECMTRPIRNNTAEEEGVYDPFLGSGTTLLSCEHLNRICYGIELDAAYCDIIVQRWVNYRKKINKDARVFKNNEECTDFR
jgi:DNA modification methylase